MTKGLNVETGTVHNAKTADGFLVQTCGIRVDQRVALDATDRPVTCKRCIASAATTRAAAVRQDDKPATISTGPVTWFIDNPAGRVQTWRTTKRDALKVAAHLGAGYTVRKG